MPDHQKTEVDSGRCFQEYVTLTLSSQNFDAPKIVNTLLTHTTKLHTIYWLKLNLYLTLLVILSWLEKSANVGLITVNLIEEKLPSGRGYFAVDAKHGSRPWLNNETRWVDLLAPFGLFCLIRQTFSGLVFLFGRREFLAHLSYLDLASSHFTVHALIGYGHHSNLI